MTYLTDSNITVKKLHLGCGGNVLPGWLNTDIVRYHQDVVYLDVTQGAFPFPDNSFDYVYTEHMIEHINYEQGVHMLRQCMRVMKPGARIRITCPDMQFLVDLYTKREGITQDYTDWTCAEVVPGVPFSHPVFAINNYVRAWGHQFIYDKESLGKTLDLLGFQDIEEFAIQESDDANLSELEIPSRMRPGFLQLESMTLEAVKPR
jgi:predicted SAM-dependent methyltransferase